MQELVAAAMAPTAVLVTNLQESAAPVRYRDYVRVSAGRDLLWRRSCCNAECAVDLIGPSA